MGASKAIFRDTARRSSTEYKIHEVQLLLDFSISFQKKVYVCFSLCSLLVVCNLVLYFYICISCLDWWLCRGQCCACCRHCCAGSPAGFRSSQYNQSLEGIQIHELQVRINHFKGANVDRISDQKTSQIYYFPHLPNLHIYVICMILNYIIQYLADFDVDTKGCLKNSNG